MRVTCPCGQLFQIRDDLAAEKFICPGCGEIVEGPLARSYKDSGRSREPSGTGGGEVPLGSRSLPDSPSANVPGVGKKSERKRRRQARTRNRGLDRANLGLAFHYASPFGVLLAMWAGWAAAGLLLAAQRPELEGARSAAAGLFVTSGILAILAALVELTTTILCLGAPNDGGRGLVIGSLVLWVLVLGLANWLPWAGDLQPLAFGLMFVAMLAGWALWMGFLRSLALYLHRPEVAEDAGRTLRAGLGTLFALLVLLLAVVGFAMLFASQHNPFIRYVLGAMAVSVLFGAARIAAATKYFDSLGQVALSPTGVTFLLRYLDLIGTMRTVIDRR